MTTEMQDMLVRQLDEAKTTDEIDRALVSSMKAVVECQCKTAKRVKDLVIERDREKAKREGAKWLWGVLGSIASAGGGAAILKALALWH